MTAPQAAEAVRGDDPAHGPEGAGEMRKLLDGHPVFATAVMRFMVLHDAAQVLGELKPQRHEAVASYLRDVARHAAHNAGMDDQFIDAMIAARPPMGKP